MGKAKELDLSDRYLNAKHPKPVSRNYELYKNRQIKKYLKK